MALIALTSANGSPGVSTLALGLALTWTRPVVLVDADPAAGAAVPAGYFKGERSFTAGAFEMAIAVRNGTLAEDLPRALAPLTDRAAFLPGLRSPAHAGGVAHLWGPLATELAAMDNHGRDVIVDAGRLGPQAAMALLKAADHTLIVIRSTLPALYAAAQWSHALTQEFAAVGRTSSLGVAVVGAGQPYGVREVERLTALPVRFKVDWDPATAEVYSLGSKPTRRFEDARLNRSLRAAVSQLRTTETTQEGTDHE